MFFTIAVGMALVAVAKAVREHPGESAYRHAAERAATAAAARSGVERGDPFAVFAPKRLVIRGVVSDHAAPDHCRGHVGVLK